MPRLSGHICWEQKCQLKCCHNDDPHHRTSNGEDWEWALLSHDLSKGDEYHCQRRNPLMRLKPTSLNKRLIHGSFYDIVGQTLVQWLRKIVHQHFPAHGGNAMGWVEKQRTHSWGWFHNESQNLEDKNTTSSRPITPKITRGDVHASIPVWCHRLLHR